MPKYTVTKDNYVAKDDVKIGNPYITRFDAEVAVLSLAHPNRCSVGRFKVEYNGGNEYMVTLGGRLVISGTEGQVIHWLKGIGRYIHINMANLLYQDIRRRHTAAAEFEINTLRALQAVYHKN